MKREEFYRGKRGAKYGIWNREKAVWQFDICEDTPFWPKRGYTRRSVTTRRNGVSRLGGCRTGKSLSSRELNTPVTFTALWWRWAWT